MGTRRRRVSVIYFISKLVKWDDLHMEIISNPTQTEIENAAQALKDGHLVAFPTETVYGLGADATNENAVSRVYSVKGRPTEHPLIVHISSINQLGKWAIDIPEYAIKLAKEFWPGPMTLILKRSEMAKDFITGTQENVGVRVPSHSVALALISEFEKLGGLGVAAPSANRFGKVSPTSITDVLEDLGKYFEEVDQILDGGRSLVGIESTIISCLSDLPSIIRPGAITFEMISKVIENTNLINNLNVVIKAPGNLAKHYSPRAKISINSKPKKGEGLIALNKIKTPEGVKRLLSPINDEEFAKGIYEALRQGDKLNLAVINVYTPENTGLGVAINDRISRAKGL
jgi:L-threonylcarbamoyladenylate synthase